MAAGAVPMMSPQNGGAKNPMAQNAGVPVLGNTGKPNPNNASSAIVPGQIKSPLITAAQATSTQASKAATPLTTNATATTTPITSATTPSTANTGTTTTTSSATSTNPALAGYTPQQYQQLQKQLVDIYGKGEGNLLFGLISGMDSSDNAYMQAYEKAMAPVNAQNLATLNTTLGNSGVSANSSAAAIADSNFEANVTGQESLVEQNLQQQSMQETIGLAQGFQNAAQKETSSSWYNDLADVLEGVGNFVKGSGNSIGQGSSSSSGSSYNVNSATGIPDGTGAADTSMGFDQPDTDTLNNAADGVSTAIAESSIDAFAF